MTDTEFSWKDWKRFTANISGTIKYVKTTPHVDDDGRRTGGRHTGPQKTMRISDNVWLFYTGKLPPKNWSNQLTKEALKRHLHTGEQLRSDNLKICIVEEPRDVGKYKEFYESVEEFIPAHMFLPSEDDLSTAGYGLFS